MNYIEILQTSIEDLRTHLNGYDKELAREEFEELLLEGYAEGIDLEQLTSRLYVYKEFLNPPIKKRSISVVEVENGFMVGLDDDLPKFIGEYGPLVHYIEQLTSDFLPHDEIWLVTSLENYTVTVEDWHKKGFIR